MSSTITSVCSKCGRSFVPSRADIIAGVWRICERCRPDVDDVDDDEAA